LHKVLESANLKLAVVATDILGTSGREMLAAILAGEAEPGVLAELARGRLRAKLPQLRAALDGRVQAQQRVLIRHVLIRHVLAHVDFLEGQLAQLTSEIEAACAPFAQAVALLGTIPGVAETAATAIVAEIGTDMRRFPSAKHLASWAGLCPGNRQRGGKRLSGRTTAGNVWLKAVLGEVAWSITPPPAPTSPRSTTGSRGGAASRKRLSPSPIVSWSASTTCCALTNPTTSLAQTISTASIPPASSAATSTAWSSSATRSR